MNKFIEAADALEKSKKACHTTEEDIIKALEGAHFNNLVTEAANKGNTSVKIGFKHPDILENTKYFLSIREYIQQLGYSIDYDHTENGWHDDGKYNYYRIYWGEQL